MKKSARSSRLYLEDMLSAIERIREYSAKGKEDFFISPLVQDAVIRQLSIIGEAAAKVPKNLQERYPKIPWRNMVGMRNIIIHDYTDTDIPTVWMVVERDLPALEKMIRNIVQKGHL